MSALKVGDRVRYSFDGTTGIVRYFVVKYRQTFAVVSFPGKAPREVPITRLEPEQ